MGKKQPGFGRRCQNFAKRIYKKRSLFLATLLFILSTAITPVVAIAVTTPIVQTQPDTAQLTNKAIKLYRSGQFEAAAATWEQTANVFAAQKDSLNQAMALSNLSLSYQQLGQWEPAKKAISESLELLKTPLKGKEELKIKAQTLDVQGYLQRETGQSADALNTWQQATKIYSQINESAKLAQSKINSAQAMQDLGLYPRACNTLVEVLNKQIGVKDCQELSQLTEEESTQTLQKVVKQSPSLPVAVGLRSLGELLRLVGQPKQSQLILATSLNQAQKLNSPQDQAATYLSIGNTAQTLAEGEKVRRKRENYEQTALEAYGNAAKLSTSPTTRQQAQLNQLSLLLKLQKVAQAEELWRSLNSELSNLSPSRTGVYLQINFAQSLVKLAQTDNFTLDTKSQLPTFNDIDRILDTAATHATSLADQRAQAYALGNRGGLYELKGPMQDLSQAENYTKQALGLASNFEAPDIAYQFFWQLGRIRRSSGDIEDAIAAYTKSYNALQSLRSDLVGINPEVQFSFRESVEPVYRQLVEADLEYAESLIKAGKNKESEALLTQSRNVIESLQLAELNNFFREACVTANPKQIDQIDRTAAVIYPIILPDRLDVLLSLPDQPPTLHTTKISQEQLENTVDNVRRSLIDPQSLVNDFLPIYQQLYSWLIQPLETQLANSKVKTLVFVLDGNLRNIPMAALHDGKQYLAGKYAIALTPGLQLVNPKPIADVDLTALTAGISEIRKGFAAHEGFTPLSNVQFELNQIKQAGFSTRSFLNDKFTSAEIKKEIDDFRFPIVHLATHAQFSSSADDTFVLSWDTRINVKQLANLLRGSTLTQRVPLELLVLSACETASGDKRAALGLAGMAVRAGARSTLATLWPVVDQSTAKIMVEFYRQLEQAKKTKINKAEALRQAQLTLMNNKQYSHPHFWTPFVLVGNWQ